MIPAYQVPKMEGYLVPNQFNENTTVHFVKGYLGFMRPINSELVGFYDINKKIIYQPTIEYQGYQSIIGPDNEFYYITPDHRLIRIRDNPPPPRRPSKRSLII